MYFNYELAPTSAVSVSQKTGQQFVQQPVHSLLCKWASNTEENSSLTFCQPRHLSWLHKKLESNLSFTPHQQSSPAHLCFDQSSEIMQKHPAESMIQKPNNLITGFHD